MKIEMDEQTTITALIFSAAMVIVLCSMGGCYMTEQTKQKAIEAGLVEKPGSSQTTIWTKP